MCNEWRANMWLTLELMIVSVVLWYCISTLFINYTVFSEPRGHDISHVYRLRFSATAEENELDAMQRADIKEELRQRIIRRPEVEAAAYSYASLPYTFSNRSSQLQDHDTVAPLYAFGALHKWVQPDFFRVFRVKGTRGESPERLAELLPAGHNVFGASEGLLCDSTYTQVNMVDQIGRKFILNGYPDHTLAAITPRFKNLDFSISDYGRCVWDMMVHPALWVADELTVRVRANMDDGSFAGKVMNDSESALRVGPYYICEVLDFDDIRANTQFEDMELMRNSTIGIAFLLLNIFLGILGTFWFRTQQRINEIAILKVCGATSATIFRRLMAEGLIILLIATPLAIMADYYIATSFELIKFHHSESVYTDLSLCAGITLIVMAIIIVCGIYFPARRAMAIEPARALCDE